MVGWSFTFETFKSDIIIFNLGLRFVIREFMSVPISMVQKRYLPVVYRLYSFPLRYLCYYLKTLGTYVTYLRTCLQYYESFVDSKTISMMANPNLTS